MPHALQTVVVTGAVELGVGLMLTLGCCTRTSAVAGALYLAASTYVLGGQHRILWMLVCATFAMSGAGAGQSTAG